VRISNDRARSGSEADGRTSRRVARLRPACLLCAALPHARRCFARFSPALVRASLSVSSAERRALVPLRLALALLRGRSTRLVDAACATHELIRRTAGQSERRLIDDDGRLIRGIDGCSRRRRCSGGVRRCGDAERATAARAECGDATRANRYAHRCGCHADETRGEHVARRVETAARKGETRGRAR
jgi:hypothetical protein